MFKPSNKMMQSSFPIGVTLVALLGGLAVVVRSLRNVHLSLYLDLKKDDNAEKKY
jgi:hypothetical protein